MLVRQRCGTLCPPSYPRAYPLHHHLFAARHRGGERHRQGRAAPCRRRSRDRGQASASWRRLERRMAGDMNERVPVMLAFGGILAASLDRKSVVKGTGVSVRVDYGCSRYTKKKTPSNLCIYTRS